ncbi:MAG TPA: hypothetical protein VMV83_00460 [Rectinemataceae bacterium]|nr:hypothetical protein [Rectinemataceae bacterium]
MSEVGYRARMGLSQFLEEIIDAVPVVFKFVVLATKMAEFEEFEKGRVVCLRNGRRTDAFVWRSMMPMSSAISFMDQSPRTADVIGVLGQNAFQLDDVEDVGNFRRRDCRARLGV